MMLDSLISRISHLLYHVLQNSPLATSLAPIPHAIKNPKIPAAIVIQKYCWQQSTVTSWRKRADWAAKDISCSFMMMLQVIYGDGVVKI